MPSLLSCESRARPASGARGLVAVAGLAAVLSTTAVAPAVAEDEDRLRERRSSVTERIGSAGAEVAESSKELAAATRVLEQVQGQLRAAQDRLAATRGELAAAVEYEKVMQERLEDAEARLAKAEAELLKGQLAVSQAEARLAQFVVSSSQYGDPSVVALDTILTGSDPTLLSQDLALTDSILGVQVASIDDLEAAKTLLAIREQEVETIRDEVDLRREEAAANVAKKQELTQRAADEAQGVRRLVEQQAAARRRAVAARRADVAQLRALEAEREALGEQLKRLARQEARRAAAAAAAAAAAEEAEDTTQSSAAPSVTSTGGGILDYPVSASVTSEFGMRFHPVLRVLKLHDGTDFGAGCGTPVQAAAAGDVVSAVGSEGYGNQLVLNHGAIDGRGVATSYSHLTSFAASPGERVERGEVIGFSGNTGYSTGCHLHFMVYENGTPVDPMGWL